MKGSWQIGRIFGIDLKIHFTFPFLLAWVAISTVMAGGEAFTVLAEVGVILVLFLFVILHEFGHALMARRFGIATTDITVLPIGGLARLEKMPEDPREEFLVAIAGPAVNVLIGGLLFAGLLITGFFAQPLNITAVVDNIWLQLLTANIVLVLFNLIPAFPMDGGRVLRAILASRMDSVKATQIAANVGRGFAVVMGIAGIFFNPFLILTALFVWSGAGAEAKAVEVKAGLKGLVVRDALISQFYQVDANQPLAGVFQLSMETGQHNLPVTSNGRFLGLIRRSDLLKAIERLGGRAPAYAAIGLEPQGLDPEMPLSDILEKFGTSRVYPVIENGQLIGLITAESVQQRMWLNQRMGTAGPNPPEETVNPA